MRFCFIHGSDQIESYVMSNFIFVINLIVLFLSRDEFFNKIILRRCSWNIDRYFKTTATVVKNKRARTPLVTSSMRVNNSRTIFFDYLVIQITLSRNAVDTKAILLFLLRMFKQTLYEKKKLLIQTIHSNAVVWIFDLSS